ncbi:MAG: hypothetical protein RL368_2178 [Pseudomonadota bacterium]|jgi:hypothetical protein
MFNCILYLLFSFFDAALPFRRLGACLNIVMNSALFYKNAQNFAENHPIPKKIMCTTSHFTVILAKIDYIIKS